jgi:hypothetical protein
VDLSDPIATALLAAEALESAGIAYDPLGRERET